MRNYITKFATGVQIGFGEGDLIVVGTVEEYMEWQLEWTLCHANGYHNFLSARAYAEKHNIPIRVVRQFADTALAYLYGVRSWVVNGKKHTSIPEGLDPSMWKFLRTKRRGREEERRTAILTHVRDHGGTNIVELLDKFSNGRNRDSWRRTIARMVREGHLRKEGKGKSTLVEKVRTRTDSDT